MGINITFDVRGLQAWADAIDRFAEELPAAASRALNRAGDQATTRVGRVLADETGAGVRDVRDSIEQVPSTPDDLVYTISVSGEWMPLSEFDPHETRKGISARLWGERRAFPNTFEFNDEVFHRTGKERLPIEKLWGPNLAVEAARGATEQVIRDTVAEVLPERLQHEIGRLWKKGGGK